MVIRCERCSTMYELDESLLASTGSEVQCTKCQHVFTAFPPRAAGRTLVGVPSAQPSAPPVVPPAAAAPPVASGPPPAASASSAPAPQPAPPRPDGAAQQRPVRTSAPAVYRPPSSGVPSGVQPISRPPVLKRDTVGAFEARLRSSARWRWLAPVLAAVVVAFVGGSWALLSRRGDAGAERSRDEALALVALDDAANVDEAISRLAAVVKKRPKLRAAAADRALALVVRAAQLGEEAEALSARAAAARDERERARREEQPGWQDAERAASTTAAALEPEIRAREERTRAVSSGAREQLAILQAEAGDTLEVMRALAALHALSGEQDRLHRVLRAAREKGLRDPWLDLAEGWGDAREGDRAGRERALVKLGALAAARPDLVRGRYLLARDQLSLGRKAEALATVDGVLAANPKHEGALRLKEELTAAPPPTPAPPPPPVAAEKPAPPPRKRVPHVVPAPSPAAAEGAAVPVAGGAAPSPSPAPPADAPPAPAQGPAAQPSPAAPPAPAPVEQPAPAPAPRKRAQPSEPPPEPEQVIQGG